MILYLLYLTEVHTMLYPALAAWIARTSSAMFLTFQSQLLFVRNHGIAYTMHATKGN